MSDKPNEGNLVDAGGTNANSSTSATSGQPLEADLPTLIVNLTKKIDAQQGEINALKSGKDKAVDRVVKSQEETFAKLAKYLNVDESQVREATRQSVLDDLVAERMGKSQPASSAGGTVEKQGAAVELQYIDTALELPANDSQVTALKLKYGSDPVAYLREGMKLKASFNQPPPSPGEQILPQGGTPSSIKSPEVLQGEYKTKMLAVPRGPKGDAARRALKDEYIKKGVDIHSVTFS